MDKDEYLVFWLIFIIGMWFGGAIIIVMKMLGFQTWLCTL